MGDGSSSEASIEPLIIIGMHRSGTSLVSALLDRAGFHMGNDRNVHDESEFFVRLNKRLFAAAHASWDYPAPVALALDVPELRAALVAELRSSLRSLASARYLGVRQFVRGARLGELTIPWGWKDPRSTMTLPFWLELFPNARVLHVYRNGVDVADSLVVRERRRIARLDSEARSCRCLSHQRSFDLWVEYVTAALDLTSAMSAEQVCHLRYESLLEAPSECVAELASFLGIAADEPELRALTGEVRSQRSFAFVRNPDLVRLYCQVEKHPLMERLSYDGVPCPPMN